MSESLQNIAVHSVAAVVLMGMTILLLRTASGLLYSRFLRHLAVSVALNVVFRLGFVVYLLLVEAVKLLTVSEPEKTKHFLSLLHSAWHGIDIAISLLSSFFLIAAWDLLRNYPSEAVSRSLYTGLISVVGGVNLGVLLQLADFTEQHKVYLWNLLDFVDIFTGTIAIGLLGFQLFRTLERQMKGRSHAVRVTLPVATLILYAIWAILQPAYLWLQGSSWYSVTLLTAGVSSQIMTVILCSQAMEEKPQYGSQAPPASMGTSGHSTAAATS